jgi:hypothetical protein
MPISWNEIRHNAIKFSRDWTGATSESAEKQTFWNEFFQVFGVSRRAVASFEEPVKKISGDYCYVDLFWPGIVLVEHKSAGKDLGKAESQAFRYIQDLERERRTREIPRYVIVSDFNRVALHDLEPEAQKGLPLFDNRRVATIQFPLAEFHKYVHAFAFVPGYKQSANHMAWIRQVCGRLKSDFQYSGSMVYNNFPWPESATDKPRAAVEAKAQAVLDAWSQFMTPVGRASSRAETSPDTLANAARRESRPTNETKPCTLADLYDPLAMPPALAQAHAALDRAVDLCYRPE